MTNRYISRSKFADLAGVSKSVITDLTKPGKRLAPALTDDGKLLDTEAAEVIIYLHDRAERNPANMPANAIDPLWDVARAWCEENSTWSSRPMEQGIEGLSRSRALKLSKAFKALGYDKEPVRERTVVTKAERFGLTPRTEPVHVALDELDGVVPESMRAVADMPLRQIVNKYGTLPQFLDILKAVGQIETIEEKRLKNRERAQELVSRELVEKGIIGPIAGVFASLLQSGAKSIALQAHTMALAGDPVSKIELETQKILTQTIKPAKTRLKRAFE